MNVLGFDTETRGLDWFDEDQRAFLLSWADSESHVCAVDDAPAVARFMRARFMRACEAADVIVAHNLSFDVHQVRESLGIDMYQFAKPLVDTAILARIVLPERAWGGGGYKLKDLAKTYLGENAKDAESAIENLAKASGIKLKSTGGYYDTWRAYPQEVEHYAKLDAEYTRDLYPLLMGKLDDRMREVWELELAATPVLIGAEARGTRVNPDVVAQLRAEYEPLAAEALERVQEELGEIELGSPDQLRAALLEHGVPLHRKTETGKLATHEFALAEFKDGYPVIADLLGWRKASKMLSTYIEPMTGREIVNPSFWQCGAKTGRMSCSRPNMQNLPAHGEVGATKLREAFVPREGFVFVACDYDSIEVRLLAHYLNRPEYTQLIEDGQDPHAWMASKIWGGEPAQYAKGTPGEKQRSQAKNVLFAIVYGAGAKRVADMLTCPYDEARSLVNTIKMSLPGYLALAGSYKPVGRVPAKVKSDGFVTTICGRKQTVARDKGYVGLNALIQGSAADIFKLGVVKACAATDHLGARPVLFVHDELVLEVPEHYAEECLALTIPAMEAAYPLSPALKVTGTIAKTSYAEGK